MVRDEGTGTGSFTCDFGQDLLTIQNLETDLSPAVVAAWIDPEISRILRPFRFTETPTIQAAGTVRLRNGSTDDLRLRINAQNPFTFQSGGSEIPCQQGSGDFTIFGGDPANFAANGAIRVQGAKISGSKLVAPLLSRLEPLGFREPLDADLKFKLDPVSFRVISLQMVSGSHSLTLNGSLFMLGGLVDLSGNVDGDSHGVRGLGTIQEPIWQLISPGPK